MTIWSGEPLDRSVAPVDDAVDRRSAVTGSRPLIRVAGQRALLLEFGSLQQVHAAWRSLRADPPPGVEDIVAGSRTVLLVLRSVAERQAAAEQLFAGFSSRPSPGSGRDLTIPVTYDGPDLADVAALTGLDESEVVRLHAGAVYTVSFVGFSPGFAYLVGVDPALHVPRLASPRRSVPAGSLALAAGMTALYPQATPGGWRLIGRSDARMFDPARPQPSLLMPGDRVRFSPVDRLGHRSQVERHPLSPLGGPRPAAPPRSRSAPRPVSDEPGKPYLQVLAVGVMATVQDSGRPGWAHLGVSPGGAADRSAARRANQLVGNSSEAALLEVTVGGLRARVGAARRVAVTGGVVDLTVDGIPARTETGLPLPAGAELSVGPCRAGLRSYLAVEGGIVVPSVLGSRSTDTLSGLGPPAVRAGDQLPLGPLGPPPAPRPARGPLPSGESPVPSAENPDGAWRPAPGEGDLVTLAARAGPRDDWVGQLGLDVLRASEYLVHPSSDRTGVRLHGPPVPLQRTDQLPSEGMVAGAVEIPPDGQPIVLLRNHPPTGGYPVAAVVDDADLDVLAQCRPGVRVRFAITP